MSNERYKPPGLEGKVQTWDVIDQCQITTTLVPFWLKFCRTTHDNFIAFFAGPDPAPYLPAATPAEGVLHWENDQFHPINANDRMLKTTSFEPLVGAYVVADFNPVPGTVDYPVIISIGGIIYMGARPYPPGSNPPKARDSQSRWKVLPKNRILVPATCTFGGVPCNPQIMATQASPITAWLPPSFGTPIIFIGLPITNRRPNNKIGFDVLTGFPGCCLQDAVLTIIDDIYGCVTIDEPVGGVIPATSLITPVVLNLDLNNPLLPTGTYNIPFNIQISSPDCGTMVFPVDIPVDVACAPQVIYNPTGGNYNLNFITPSDGIAHTVLPPGVVGPTTPPVKNRDADVPGTAYFDLTWASCCLDDALVDVDDPSGVVTMAGGGPQGVPNGTAIPAIGLLINFALIPPGDSGNINFNLVLTTTNCGTQIIPYSIPYSLCPCSFTAAENNTVWYRTSAPGIPVATPLVVNNPFSVYTPDIDVDLTYSQCMLEDVTASIIATGGRVLHYIAGPPIGITNGTPSQVLSGFVFDLQAVDPSDLVAGNIAFTLQLTSATCGQVFIPFLIPITP